MKKILIITAFCFSITTSFAYPITPRPLRKLVMESQLIAHAYVIKLGSEKVEAPKNKKKYYYETEKYYALIAVKEVLQGSVAKDTLKIFYPRNYICPAPPEFVENSEIIVFLDTIENTKEEYEVHALSYGVKTFFNTEGILAYKERILEIQEIIKLPETQKKNDAILEWLVKCAENKYTRWEGVYELSPQNDFMSYYDENSDVLPKGNFLTHEHRKRLFNSLMNTDTTGYSDIGLVDLCISIDDERLLGFLKSKILLFNAETIWVASYYMEKIILLTKNSELESIMNQFNEIRFRFDDESEKKQNEVLKLFIEKLNTIELKNKTINTGRLNT